MSLRVSRIGVLSEESSIEFSILRVVWFGSVD
jgi:hypothetical protein